MYKDPLGNTYASYEEYVNSPDLDTDLICIKLWRGVRTPQNDNERRIKKELDEIKRKGLVQSSISIDSTSWKMSLQQKGSVDKSGGLL